MGIPSLTGRVENKLGLLEGSIGELPFYVKQRRHRKNARFIAPGWNPPRSIFDGKGKEMVLMISHPVFQK